MSEPTAETPSETAETGGITVYWRPGCGFCSMLLRQLDKQEVPHRRINIWEEPEAAAIVRSFADGNETVPTVQIGPVGLVNPSVDEVLVAATEHVPQAVPEGWTRPEPGRLASWVSRRLGGS
jgi:glutaredoxin